MWVVKGMKGTNKMMVYVEEYFNKKTLATLGYSFDTSDLSVTDADAFHTIESVIKKHEADEMKKIRVKNKKR